MNAASHPVRDLTALAKVLNRITDPSARKSVLMGKWERREITPQEAERLMRLCCVEAA
jgi:hypothetical protein